jgi:predicted DNA-binding ribbon-helix-helix protein
MSTLVKRSFSLAGHRTSVALEPAFWDALAAVAARRGQALSRLVAEVDANRSPDHPLASALRVLALREAQRP